MEIWRREDTEISDLIDQLIGPSRGSVTEPDLRFPPGEKEREFYNLSFLNHGIIRVVPNIESAVRYYDDESSEYELKRETYRGFLDKLRSRPELPVSRIVAYLEDNINGISIRKFKNRLARAVEQYKTYRESLTYAESALEATLIILYEQDKDAALELVETAGISTPIEFVEGLWMYEWFFLDDETSLTEDQKFGKFIGILNGPNDFLHRLKNH